MLYSLITKEINYVSPSDLFASFCNQPFAILLESGRQMEGCGRYSFIAVDPFMTLTCKNKVVKKNNEIVTGNPFDILKQELNRYYHPALPNLPPFQGGAAGYFGYELYQHLENIPLAKQDDLNINDMMIGFYDLVISFDHLEKRAWIISTGFPEIENKAKKIRCEKRLEWLAAQLFNTSNTLRNGACAPHQGERVDPQDEQFHPQSEQPFEIAPPFPAGMAGAKSAFSSNFSQEDYQQAVQKVIDYISAGDIFEANISQRFHMSRPQDFSPFALYLDLKKRNTAPFSAYLNFNELSLVSASPERFLKLTHGEVETRPIKGTRRRGKTTEEDEQLAQELLSSEKDHAENVMIVDLMRNDLSRVCEEHSVIVSKLCGLESYAVHHLVSIVHGKLKPFYHAVDLLKACFPGGSITGAPKIRAMEIIASIEPCFRGPYCGSIGYIGFNGDMDTSITIRTFCITPDAISFQTGGAVVLDSCPMKEYEETLTKAETLYACVDSMTSVPAEHRELLTP